ncbi:hypothetical protein V6Z12_D10G260200 [Gossypium hirsutum]
MYMSIYIYICILEKNVFHALFPSLKILSSLFFSGEIPVTGPPPLVAPPPSPATAHGGRKFKRYGGARHAGMVLAEAWGVVADMVVTKDSASVRGKWGVVAKVSCCLFLFFFMLG